MLKNGDIEIMNGKISTVSGNIKLNQQLLKIIITSLKNYLHPNYGSEIMDLLGKPYTTLEGTVKATVRNAMDYFIVLQKRNILLDRYDMEEILYKILYMHLQQFSGDPRGCRLQISALDGTHRNIEIDQTFS
jgi:hypothetical protein